jgi:hypothetical protein
MWRLWVRISSGEWMSVYCEFCVLSGRGLCFMSFRLWCVVVCEIEASRRRGPWPAWDHDSRGTMTRVGPWLAWGRTATKKNRILQLPVHRLYGSGWNTVPDLAHLRRCQLEQYMMVKVKFRLNLRGPSRCVSDKHTNNILFRQHNFVISNDNH